MGKKNGLGVVPADHYGTTRKTRKRLFPGAVLEVSVVTPDNTKGVFASTRNLF
jgi:hypothetical protein